MRQLDHYLIRQRSLFDRSPELQARFVDYADPDFDDFIDTEAVLYFRELSDVAVPLPDWRDMITVGGETDIRIFLQFGMACFKTIFANIPSAPIASKRTLLDFGVGCARTMRFFFRLQDQFECFGCDVDVSCIAYCKQIEFLNAISSGNNPPLPYAKEFFDVIYSLSVFSHFNYASFAEWFREIARISKPGARLLITLHGELAFDKVDQDIQCRSLININSEQFQEGKHHFKTEGFLWLDQVTGSSCIDTAQYGISFVKPEAIQQMLPNEIRVLDYKAGAIGGWQDLLIAQKK